ncbi:MAG TPA: hypothetical protein VL402_00835 [Xanthobacteraceae bacterium]|jgi:hypothetical protein|nr:hypothetical protein [Xanthobacteraceae bacterium]
MSTLKTLWHPPRRKRQIGSNCLNGCVTGLFHSLSAPEFLRDVIPSRATTIHFAALRRRLLRRKFLAAKCPIAVLSEGG